MIQTNSPKLVCSAILAPLMLNFAIEFLYLVHNALEIFYIIWNMVVFRH